MLCDHVVQYYSTTTKYYESTTPYCKVPLQYYNVLVQYYKVLLQKTQNTTINTQTKNLKTPPQTHQAPFTPGTCYTKHLVHQTPLPMCPCLHLFNSVEAARKDMRLSRRKTHMLNPHHISNLIYNARSNRCPPPTSANTAPATKIDTAKFQRKCPKTGETSFPMGGRSEHDPSMIRAWSNHDPSMIRAWKRKPQPASQVRLLFEIPRSIFYCKIQRFAPNLTFKPSPSAAPATKRYTWPSPSAAPATKSDPGTSPNIAPTTKNKTGTSPSTVPATKSDTWTSPNIAPTTKK